MPKPSARLILPALAVAACCLVSAPAPARDAEPNGATIQWAQQILDDKGFYQGRASGKLDSATAAAISAYQKSVGLKATGRLDKATVDRLLAERSEKQAPTVGNLADPNSRAKPSSPMLREEEVRPQAAPTIRGVERGEGGEQTLLNTAPPDIARPAAGSPPGATPRAAPPAARVEPSPGAAPAPSVTAGDPAGPSAAPRASVEAEGGPEGGFDLSALTASNGVRYGLLGATGLIVLGMLFAWWRGGRVPAAPKPAPRAAAAPAPTATRRAPSLGGTSQPGRQGPTLTATPRAGMRPNR
ncbi:peptidoglycan-binding protein [Aerophototrophica crusticola]|uniref:Peptidoglycan-binding protein n=1 Tax=Aerophototrophica crusticola TaxID=1709002 RepID=A0A858R809_9PROT|nr:peptidoglycan-binding protein [Rhodospirillaceae bacterium B3]